MCWNQSSRWYKERSPKKAAAMGWWWWRMLHASPPMAAFALELLMGVGRPMQNAQDSVNSDLKVIL